MVILENVVIAIFALWSLISVCYAIRIPGLHRILARINWVSAWVRWALFNSDDPAVRPAYFEIEYRDREAGGRVSPWITGMTGYSWMWRAGLWSPERRICDSIHHLGKAIKSCIEQGGAGAKVLSTHVAVIETYLRRKDPPPPGSERDFRVIRRIRSLGGEIIYTFTRHTHVLDR